MDLLADVLAGLRLESTVFCHAALSAPWGFSKDALAGAPFHAVTEGRAWVRIEGAPEALELGAGDLVVLPHGHAHTLAGSPEAETTSFTALLGARGAELWKPGQRCAGPVRLVHGGGGAATALVSGVFAFADRRRNPLVAALPDVLLVRGSEGQGVPWLDTTLRYLAAEAQDAQPGAAAVSARLADILFIQAVRAHLAGQGASGSAQPQGWLRGMGDPQVGRALALIHASPAEPWTVASLAQAVGLSRSGFAARFRQLVGRGAIDYLAEWRMHEAAGRMASGGAGSLAQVAADAGYASDVAFRKAFKRRLGMAPAAYRRASVDL